MGKHPAIEYAEDTLGVHSVHAEAVDLLNTLGGLTTELTKLHGTIRMCEHDLSQRELEVTQSVDPKEHSSKTALQEAVKAALKADDECRSFRQRIANARSEVHTVEGEVRLTEWRLKVTIARMEELGGLLNFFAATKLKG